MTDSDYIPTIEVSWGVADDIQRLNRFSVRDGWMGSREVSVTSSDDETEYPRLAVRATIGDSAWVRDMADAFEDASGGSKWHIPLQIHQDGLFKRPPDPEGHMMIPVGAKIQIGPGNSFSIPVCLSMDLGEGRDDIICTVEMPTGIASSVADALRDNEDLTVDDGYITETTEDDDPEEQGLCDEDRTEGTVDSGPAAVGNGGFTIRPRHR